MNFPRSQVLRRDFVQSFDAMKRNVSVELGGPPMNLDINQSGEGHQIFRTLVPWSIPCVK